MKYLEIGKRFRLKQNLMTMGGDVHEAGDIMKCINVYERNTLKAFVMTNVRTGKDMLVPFEKFAARLERVKDSQ